MLKENPNNKRISTDLNFDLPFKDETFDTIIASFVLNYIKNLDLLLANLKSILKGNGRLIALQCPLNQWYKNQSKYTTEQVIESIKTHFTVKTEKHKKITLIIAK